MSLGPNTGEMRLVFWISTLTLKMVLELHTIMEASGPNPA